MKLIICGNGFDLHHGLPTAYKNYKEYLCRKYSETVREYEDFVGVYDNDRIAWSNIEDALKIDYLKMLCRYADLPSTTDEVYFRSHMNDVQFYLVNELEEAFKGLTNFITNFTGKYLYDWLSSIDIKQAVPDLSLCSDDLYVNFNYLDTLQTLYHIPDNNVFHIHGSLKRLSGMRKATSECKKDCLATYIPEVGKKEAEEIWKTRIGPSFQSMYVRQELQFGAVINRNMEMTRLKKWYHSDEAYADYLDPSIRVIDDFIDKSTKRLVRNYKMLTHFVWTQNSINTIEIMGHTLNGMDYPYYKEIIVPFFRDRLWVFWCHGGNTQDATSFIEKAQIKNYKFNLW